MSLIVERDGAVLNVVLDRPDRYNAMDDSMVDELVAAFDSSEAEGARVIAVRGSGKGFSSGLDLSGAAPTGYDVIIRMRHAQRLVASVVNCPVPIVVGVHGVCAGLALSIALAADICVAENDASFSAAFVHRGLVPDGGIGFLLPRLIGLAKSKTFLLLGETMSGAAAAEAGVIARAVEPGKLDVAVAEVVDQFASLPTRAIAYCKRLLARTFEYDLASYFDAEAAGNAVMSTTDDLAEGIAAFFEKRKPEFTGR